MTVKRFEGVEIVNDPSLPVEILNEETNEFEVFHMIREGYTLFISKEVYEELIKEVEK